MRLTKTNLERLRFAHQGWNVLYNANLNRLNGTLLKIFGLTDVNITSLTDKDVLVWNSGTSKWVNLPSGFLTTTTTTTTT